jgi:glutamyl-tRNA synthetase
VSGGRDFWEAVRPNIARLSDAADLWGIVSGTIVPVVEDTALLGKASELLPPEPWSEATWGAWTSELARVTGAKGRALFHPLRLALTGREHGPELKKLLPLIGRAKSVARLNGEAA